jgi:hypothetical protein
VSRTRSFEDRSQTPEAEHDEARDAGAEDSPADRAADAAEDALDLSDLDRLDREDGFGTSGDEDDLVLDPPRRRPRSPVLSLFVIAFAVYLLTSMWSDFRYWMQPAEPLDLGHASEFVQEDGHMPPGHHDRYVVLEGTPDVQHAARLTTNEGFMGYLRVTEGGGRLFAAVPRGPEEKMLTDFEGRYEGRMRRLGSDRAFPWLEQFFDGQGVMRAVDSSPEHLLEALRRAGETFEVETEEGPIRLAPDAIVRLVTERPEARVQLGVTTFPDAQEAEARVAALGFPYARVGRPESFHSFVVRIPIAEREAARARLLEDADAPAASNDPKVGVAVLPMTATFTAPAPVLQLDGDGRTLVFPYGDNTTVPGYEVSDGQLVAIVLDEEAVVRIAPEQLAAVRIEQPIRIDPEGYVIVVGATPSSARTLGILWLVALGIGLVNLASLLLWWRRRTA